MKYSADSVECGNFMHNRDSQEYCDRQSSPIIDARSSVSGQRSSHDAVSSLEQDHSKESYTEDYAKEDYLRVPSCAPPAYAAGSSAPASVLTRHLTRQPVQNVEDPLELLRQFNTVIILDDSTSMSHYSYERHMPDGNFEKVTWWQEARIALVNLAVKAAEYDDDGIDIHFLNSSRVGRNLKVLFETREAVQNVFKGINTRPGTPIGARLDTVIREYMKEYASWRKPSFLDKMRRKKTLKKLNILVITDGYPTDEPKQVISDLVREMDKLEMEYNRVGVQFVQIGNSHDAKKYLEELDGDKQQHAALRDIVDTTQYIAGPLDANPETMVKILLGGIHRRIDHEGASVVLFNEGDEEEKRHESGHYNGETLFGRK
ncbi:uncharacterized protein PHACADRAFT_25617 [Phanerochaete carnosa HHB-10118-sp]|uniref:VWFA domain-containing protein n=1 Tax=Phanerochaete carnosa (strain HHB-10118-sp) TaxID=650164 RepID=K5WK35_PHACS|nr:uncharacterized protein PHACADRAFT_25617 [Phanerochaete carnosa HHB-10118-sp]EKM59504.1 hypothetical protein PHACADRAFT_25617 [Phanerochaete carnosa HHB-10118-sp]